MGLDYRQAGVDIDKGDRLIPVYRESAEKTRIPGVLGSLGGFGSLFSLKEYGFEDPVLVSGTDGVGTKLLLAKELGRHDTVGIDLVAMCVNDIITCGAKPLFFLDYFGSGALDPDTAAAVVRGIAEGCSRSGCALIGGETAELPGMYPPGEYDLAGFAVGAADRKNLIDGRKICVGDAVIGLASSGIHSNGYSLVRKVIEVAGLELSGEYAPGRDLGSALLEPTRIYAKDVEALSAAVEVRGLAHITGGGLPGNACRILPEGTGMLIREGSWEIPELFSLLEKKGAVAREEMYRTFNMGIGMAVVVPSGQLDTALETLNVAGTPAFPIGEITTGEQKVVIR